jgi:hypothetical protein
VLGPNFRWPNATQWLESAKLYRNAYNTSMHTHCTYICACVYACIHIQVVSKPMSQTFPGYSPPPLKQKSSYQHGSKSEQVPAGMRQGIHDVTSHWMCCSKWSALWNILCNTQYQHMNVSQYLGTCSLLDPCL